MNEAGILHTKDGKSSNITPQKLNKSLEIYQNDSSLNGRDLFPADMLIISERSNTESILRASKGTFNDTNHENRWQFSLSSVLNDPLLE